MFGYSSVFFRIGYNFFIVLQHSSLYWWLSGLNRWLSARWLAGWSFWVAGSNLCPDKEVAQLHSTHTMG